jgi:hypothetical protein
MLDLAVLIKAPIAGKKRFTPNNLPGGAKQLLPRPKAEQAVGTFCKWIRCTEHGGSKGIAA